MLTKAKIKVFDMNNPNCEFLAMPLPSMFYGKPILFNDNPIGHISDDYNSFEVIGSELLADVYFYEEYINKDITELKFSNYMVDVTNIDGYLKLFEIIDFRSVSVE